MHRGLAFAAVLAVGVAIATPTASAQAPTQDALVFSGTFSGLSFDIDIRSGPSGEDPTGRVLIRYAATGVTFFEGPPTCLSVLSSDVGRNWVGVFQVQFVDFGTLTFQAQKSETTELGFLEVGRTERALDDCSPTPDYIFGTISGYGDLTLVDAEPRPVPKDLCKNGAWRDYGVFKSQGDCISYITTGGRNPPGEQPSRGS